MFILNFIANVLVLTACIYGSIKLVDRYNSRNKLGTAAVIALVFAIFGGMGGSILFFLPLLAYFFILVKYYDLSFLQAIISVVVIFVSLFVLAFVIALLISPPDESEELLSLLMG